MWFYMIAGFLLLVGLIGGLASGGIFTLIFIPLGASMLVVAVVFGMWSRAQQGARAARRRRPRPSRHPCGTPRRRAHHADQAGELVDARRVQQ